MTDLIRAQFVIARSATTWRSRYHSDDYTSNKIATLRLAMTVRLKLGTSEPHEVFYD